MPLLIIGLGIVLLLILIMGLKMNTFISLIITSTVVAILLGIPLDKIVTSIETGMGGTLGHIALIFGLGAILGKLIADAGGAHQIAHTLIGKFGEKRIQIAILIASFIIGIALFMEVAIVLIIPIVISIAKELKMPLVKLAIPMATAVCATHAFLPPHPGPIAVSAEYGANVGLVLIYGIIVAFPTVLIAAFIFPKLAMKYVPSAFTMNQIERSSFASHEEPKFEKLPGFGISLFTALFPVILMMIGAAVDIAQKQMGFESNLFVNIIRLLTNSGVAMLLSVLLAFYTMGYKQGIRSKQIGITVTNAVNSMGMLLLVIGGGGALKQVIIDGGVGDYIAKLFEGSTMSPVFLAWMVAALLRISLGSGTVAMLTTAGLVLPSLQGVSGVNLELVALATGAGSATASHVNDAGFWIIKESLGLNLKEGLGIYTVLSTIVSVGGICFILLLDLFV
ncbi:gluconate permease [Macrococcoides canis]|uniref:gluconate:H+ symporter n=1 Tax=Macrococcoides canis TaxID=1855823 RepID=UPI00105BC5D9|nr:gluconate:H+ symporter [Macrococcus canis]TDM20551.1 gluconate permease [Macrococcus canis]TDM36369.1 gluconate permease [Macrococcus canis]